jgi:uncharacterized protein (DUF2235 family)
LPCSWLPERIKQWPMSRNVIVCCDGTDNAFGQHNSNVVRLIQSLKRDPTKQRLYYDPGIGTFPATSAWNPLALIREKIANVADRMIAWRLEGNVQEAYAYLMNYWELGDRVFLIGFSRGAYTVRVLAGMLHVMGLLPRGNENLIPYVMSIYKSLRGAERTSDYYRLSSQFRTTFSRETGQRVRRFPVHFLGVWDTVSTVGWIWNPASYPYTHSNPSVGIVRHAVSIDERRAFFRQNALRRRKGKDVSELWFAGDHSDIGGGHPEDAGGLWRVSFQWMVDVAKDAGMEIDEERLKKVLERSKPPDSPWLEPQHSLLRDWWLAELVPKKQWDVKSSRMTWTIGWFGYRTVPKDAEFHDSVTKRLAGGIGYAPPNLPPGKAHDTERADS